MKKLLTILIGACLLSVVLTGTSYAACPSPDGQTYQLSGCSVLFQRAPFGPSEFGQITLTCDGVDVMYGYYCYPDKCLIVIRTPGGETIGYLWQIGDQMQLSWEPPLIR